jgi:hypothetical protein
LSVARLSILTLLALLFTAISGCTDREPAIVEVPGEISKVTEPFLKAMKDGKRDEAMKLVSTAAQDEFDAQYAADQKALATAPKLTPRFIKLPLSFEGLETDSKETNVVYAAKKGEQWTTINIRLYSYRDEPYTVEYWRVTNKAPSPVVKTSVEEKAEEQVKKTMVPTMIGTSLMLVVLGAVGIALLLWLVKRKPHMVLPEAQEQTKRSAVTVREAGEDA